MSDLLVLRVGIDTLEVTFNGEVTPEHLEALEVLKLLAQETETPRPYVLAGVEFMVSGKGTSAWSYKLHTRDFTLFVSRSKNAFYPKVKVSLGAFGLATRHHTELWGEVLRVIGALGELEEHGVSRADVYVDFQGWTPTLTEMSQNIACRARNNPIYPNIQTPETFYFGMGAPQMMRAYNKTLEAAHSGKAWLFAIYEEIVGFDVDAETWRIEFQIRRDILRELGVRSSHQVFSDPGALLDYGMSKFAQLRVPTGDQTITRWPEDPRWSFLRNAVSPSQNLVRARSIARLMPLDMVISRHLGLVATAAAHFGTTDYMETLQRLSYQAEAHMITEKIDFDAMAEVRRRRLGLTRDPDDLSDLF